MDELLHHSNRQPQLPAGPAGSVGQLVQGSSGLEVKNLQRALNYHLPELLPPLVPDGIFGPRTHARVARFQELYDIPPPRGLVGPLTQRALYTFVQLKHHVLFADYHGIPIGGSPGRPGSLAFGDLVRPSPLPPIPRTPFPFPDRFLLPPLRLPAIEPRILALLRKVEVEVEAGSEVKFSTLIGQSSEPAQLVMFTDFKATVWSKPLMKDVVDASVGAGVLMEKRLTAPGGPETSAYIFATVDVLGPKVGALRLVALMAEGQVKGLPGGPPEMSAAVKAGPQIEATEGGRKWKFGVGVGAEVSKDHDGYRLGASVFTTATLSW